VLDLADALVQSGLFVAHGGGASERALDALGVGVQRIELLVGRRDGGGQSCALGGVRITRAPEQ
jgi:hypothetical protein